MSSSATPMKSPPQPATEADLLALEDEGRGFELIDGGLIEKEASPPHGYGQSRISGLLFPYSRRRSGGPGGWWILTEQLVRLGTQVPRPDLAGWRREAMPTLPKEAVILQRPDWIGEILSPSNARNDLVRKKRLYHQHEVPHYWIVDPMRETLTVHRWTPAGYTEILAAQSGDMVRAEPFDQVELDVAELFGDEA